MPEIAIPLLIFLLPLAYSPGPGNMVFAANGARFGFSATIPANAGYHIATLAVTIAIGLGFAAALERFPTAFHTLKIAGALYVLWLAAKLIRSGILEGSAQPQPVSFWGGIVLLVFNPKAYVIIALMFTQFLGTSEGNPLLPVLLIATLFTLNNLVAFSLWAWMGDAIARRFRTPESAARLNLLFGTLLAATALWMLIA